MTPEGESPVKDARRVFPDKYPTPIERDYHSQGPSATRENGHMLALSTFVEKLFPTPRTSSLCGGTGSWEQIHSNPNLTEYEKRALSSTFGELNPDWEEWLMCFPIGWTDIDTPWNRLYWLNPSHDPASDGWMTRTTNVKKNRVHRVKIIGNAQYPPTAAVMFEWGVALLDSKLGFTECA